MLSRPRLCDHGTFVLDLRNFLMKATMPSGGAAALGRVTRSLYGRGAPTGETGAVDGSPGTPPVESSVRSPLESSSMIKSEGALA
jgi:hypothetical protein